MSLMNLDAKILNKVTADQIRQHFIRSSHHNHGRFTPESKGGPTRENRQIATPHTRRKGKTCVPINRHEKQVTKCNNLPWRNTPQSRNGRERPHVMKGTYLNPAPNPRRRDAHPSTKARLSAPRCCSVLHSPAEQPGKKKRGVQIGEKESESISTACVLTPLVENPTESTGSCGGQ